MPAEFEHRPELLRQRDVPCPQAFGRPVRQVQLIEIPPQLLELHVEDFVDAIAGLQRRDESESPQPVILRQSAEPFFFAWLQAPFALELAQLANAGRDWPSGTRAPESS